MMNTSAKQQQRPLQDQSGPSLAQRSHRGPPGRGGRQPPNGGPPNKQSINKTQRDATAQPAKADAVAHDHGSDDPVNSAQINSDQAGSSDAQRTSNPRPRNQRSTRGGGGGGKYKQRQQLNQLIDGMDGLDIDLVESIAPSGSHGRSGESGKGRHATVSRKVNLTHLLNYDRRQRGGRHHQHHNMSHVDVDRSNHHAHTYYRDFNTAHKFSKQQFLQANCQFVVLPFHDYSIHKVNPDWPIDWDCIEEVKFRQTGTTETTCPICLDPPIAAKITRCGHIYCWTCMLHYLSLNDERSRQCPICFEPIMESDLRSVVPKLYSNHSVDEEITMQLMFREKGCVEIESYKGIEHSSPRVGQSDNAEANLLIVNPTTVITEVVKREQDELMLKLDLDRDEPEVCFIEQAMDRLNRRIEGLQEMSIDTSKLARNRQDCNQTIESRTEKSFLFYQSSDGQHIYLNPFSTKILCQEYGSLENCPLEIRANVLQMDWISMSESWRKRFKYLEHLPLTCEFRLIEIDFEKSNLVSMETYKLFEDQIKMRARERAFRKTEELKRDKIIQIEQNRKIYGIQPSLDINLDNEEQFPSVLDESRLFHMRSRPESSELEDNQPEALTRTSESSDHLQDFEPETSATLSFKEIQERQAAAETANPNKSQCTNSWAANRGQAKGTQSSFAKLLVDAKTNQKQWTKNSNAATRLPAQPSFASSASGSSQLRPTTSIDPDDNGEELRAPPSTFTISDFIDAKPIGRRAAKKS